jgi:hypothetical protein
MPRVTEFWPEIVGRPRSSLSRHLGFTSGIGYVAFSFVRKPFIGRRLRSLAWFHPGELGATARIRLILMFL